MGAEALRSLIDTLPVIVFRVSLWPVFGIDYVSSAVHSILGYAPEDVAAEPDLILRGIHPDDRPFFERLCRSPAELASPFVLRCIHTDGGIVWCEFRCNLQYESGRLVAIDGISADVTAPRVSDAAPTPRALYDPVTGLPNRMLFREHLNHAYSRRVRGRPSPVLLVAHFDHFRAVDRQHGRAMTDSVLGELATRVGTVSGDDATVGRTGDDEFTILFEDHDELELPVRVAEELRTVFSTGIDVDGVQVGTTASMGIAYARPDATDSAEDLLEHAYTALESARRQGGDRYEVFDRDLGERAGVRLRVEADLRRALERDEFALVYQPEVVLETGETVAVEALLRWRHPERGLLEPQDFLYAAEASGLMVPIGMWVLEEACHAQADWARRRQGRPPPAVVVNLSPRQLGDADVVSDVAAVLARTGVDPGGLCLDVTEAALAEDPVAAQAVLQALRRLGIRVAVDDFGTGYASLSIVRTFPVDAVKIDHSIVAALDSDPAAVGLCSAVVDLAAGCGLDVSAEGVETASQRDRLSALGVTRGQGDFFRTPSPPESLGLTLALVE
ncbi:MAG: EAL domain-containing protein [Acidimicrobiia bacterium]